MNKTYTICVIRGDGIGPEVISEALRLLGSISLSFRFIEGHAGYQCYLDTGTPLPKSTIAKARQADAVLFGAVTTPFNIKNYSSPIVALRRVLDLYANVRPIFSLPLPGMRQDIDFVIVRENTEGLYIGRERLIRGGALSERVITKAGAERIVDFAVILASEQARRKVTVVHKANILRLTDGLFLEVAKKIAGKYPDIIFEDMIVDACAMNLVRKPERFDVLVTTNMFGDILSDEASALVGGLGVAASANIGDRYALFEPVHGSAPKYKGRNIANPLASFFAVVLMLEFLGEGKIADRMRQSILKTIRSGFVTADLGGSKTTSEVADEVIKNLE